MLFAAATAALIAIGVFNESFHEVHYAVSVAFFVLAPLALFVISCAFALAHHSAMAGFTVTIAVVAALPWLLEFAIHFVPAVAIPETISAVAVSAWILTLSHRILRRLKN